jgi:hypothetical protein
MFDQEAIFHGYVRLDYCTFHIACGCSVGLLGHVTTWCSYLNKVPSGCWPIFKKKMLIIYSIYLLVICISQIKSNLTGLFCLTWNTVFQYL